MSGALDRAALARAFAEIGVRAAPVKAWYTIQDMTYQKGLIRDGNIENCKYMYFNIGEVVAIYRNELEKRPFELYGLTKE